MTEETEGTDARAVSLIVRFEDSTRLRAEYVEPYVAHGYENKAKIVIHGHPLALFLEIGAARRLVEELQRALGEHDESTS